MSGLTPLERELVEVLRKAQVQLIAHLLDDCSVDRARAEVAYIDAAIARAKAQEKSE